MLPCFRVPSLSLLLQLRQNLQRLERRRAIEIDLPESFAKEGVALDGHLEETELLLRSVWLTAQGWSAAARELVLFERAQNVARSGDDWRWKPS